MWTNFTAIFIALALLLAGCKKEGPAPSPTPDPDRNSGSDSEWVDMSEDILPLITDPAWRAYCIKQLKEGDWDKANNEVLSSWEANFVKTISVASLGIKELQALKYFHGLESLDCRGNELTALNTSESYLLKSLNCENNLLTGLYIASLINLETLSVSGNPGKDGKFVITAAFDNASVPDGFPVGGWDYNGQPVVIDYAEISW